MGKCGREISPDRWYRVIARRLGARDYDVLLLASAPTILRAMALAETVASAPGLSGWQIWVERCYRATERITLEATDGGQAPTVEREGG